MNPLLLATASTCTLNGKDVPCEELTEAVQEFLPVFGGLMIVFMALGVFSFVFWIMMLVHACTHEIKDRAMWIILMVFTGFIGAAIYYFAVKRELKD